jgi:hypothetical protein
MSYSDEEHVGGNRPRFGIYTGIVHDNADPEKAGRLRVVVPSVMGTEPLACWAVMIGQHAGPRRRTNGGRGRGRFEVPPVGAQVVVQFLDGDVHAPVWTPGAWPRAMVPPRVKGNDYPARTQVVSAEKLEVVEDANGNILVTTDLRNLGIEVDTRGGDINVRTDGAGDGVVNFQQGTTLQRVVRVTDEVVCSTLVLAVNPTTSDILSVTEVPPAGMGEPVTINAASIAAGQATITIRAKLTGGAPKVLAGG